MRGRAWVAGESSLPWGAGGFPSSGKLARVELIEHFCQPTDGLTGMAAAVSGTGASVTGGTAPAGRIGVTEITTGTTTTGRSAVQSTVTAVLLGGGRHRYRIDANVPTASDGTDTFTVHLGYFDNLGSEPTDGVCFRYTHGTNSSRWECVTRSNGSETATDSGVGLSAGTFRVFEIEANAAGTSVAFYIDGVLKATHTENIPTGSGREMGFGARILKSAGTTSRSVQLDLIAWSFEPSTVL